MKIGSKNWSQFLILFRTGFFPRSIGWTNEWLLSYLKSDWRVMFFSIIVNNGSPLLKFLLICICSSLFGWNRKSMFCTLVWWTDRNGTRHRQNERSNIVMLEMFNAKRSLMETKDRVKRYLSKKFLILWWQWNSLTYYWNMIRTTTEFGILTIQ